MPALLPRCALLAATALTATFMTPLAAQASGVTDADVESAKAEVSQLAEEVDAASVQYEAVEARLESSSARVEAARARVASQAAVIAKLETELAGLAVETFKRGGVDPRLTALSGSADYAEGTDTLTMVAERQAISLSDIEDAQVVLERAQATAVTELDEVKTLEAELVKRRADIEARLEGAKDSLAVVEAENQARLAAEEARRVEQASRSAAADAEAAAAAAPAGDAAEVPAEAPATADEPDTEADADAVAPAAAADTAPSSGGFATPTSGRFSSPFGYRMHPVYGYSKLHKGADIATGCGTPVVAAQDGVVESAKWNGSYGNYVVLQHGGSLSTAYAHLEGFAVTSGSVSKGETIGYVGTTGVSTGCHLHFEVREGGEFVDPMGYL